MPILALLLAAAVLSPAPGTAIPDTNICLGRCPIPPDSNLRPLAFLAGSCWRATYIRGGMTDTHCFAWMLGGHFLRDRHRGSQGEDAGETIYRWDPAGRRIRWDYYSSRGLLGSGTLTRTSYGLVHEYRSSEFGRPTPTRVSWRRVGADSYIETTEYRERGHWRTEPDPPRYRRIGPAKTG